MVYLLILAAALSRLLPHLPNATPVAAMALFGAALLPRRGVALAAPLLALFISDIFLGFYSPTGMLSVYGATLLVGLLGFVVLPSERPRPAHIALASIVGSVLFYVITNGACWWTGYPHTYAGLSLCFTLALPFFRNETIATLGYCFLLFGARELAERMAKSPAAVAR
jgi:hypothetical protein